MPQKKPKKRKPKARRKAVNVEQPNNIPYIKVRVEWIDILSDSGWADEKNFDKMALAKPVNEGWLYKKMVKLLSCLLLMIGMRTVL